MKQIIKNALGYLGYEISKAHSKKNGFAFSGIVYEADACSVGRTAEGEQAAEGAIRMIQSRKLKRLKILDMGCGVGIIGLTLYHRLNKEDQVAEAVFSDINVFNLHSLHRTLKKNNIDHLLGDRIRYYLSDGFQNIPKHEKFDLIIGNPPHLISDDSFAEWLSPGKLGTYDSNWSFHEGFYKACSDYLNPNGEIWLFENAASEARNFMPFIERNANLKFVEQYAEPLNSRFYWMISQKVS